ncbi:RNA polymerase sigma-70 factor [Sanguibacteroides justesenii]|uniref:RNA polymerase subunit sigma-24 n=2 Tax=Porphyromonadaceae TaxID=171551 RepID=A0A0C3NIQ3_9PORP|nr:RNA polymerase subunit sigma-24 [Sanguibacteroides justesenii]KIO47427.1 RNA polymerase subunit sigma-24 [Sanguibacteroides justesenii]PXZ42946.1 RNA polymerase sigma-70 factor [Sanguibacteroides justesenii]
MMEELFDGQTFEKLFSKHFSNLTGFAYNYVRDEEIAKDIVHDAFLLLWNKRKCLNPVYPVKSYLFALAQHKALNYLRHLSVVKTSEYELETLFDSAAGELDEHEKRLVRLEEQLCLLSEMQHDVLIKCVVEGKKYKEVAEELGISLNTVKTHLARALRFLRNELEDRVIMFFIRYK